MLWNLLFVKRNKDQINLFAEQSDYQFSPKT